MKFRLVDRIVAWEPRESIQGIKTVSFEEYQLKSAWGDEPALPESLLIESLLQLGNWLVILTSNFTEMALVVRIQEIQLRDRLRPGESLTGEVNIRSYRTDGIVFDGRARVGRKIVAEGRGCLASPVPLADYHDPEDLRVLFSEIYLPDGEASGELE